MQRMQPGAEHGQLMRRCGTFDVACTMWMDPATPPMQSKGRAVLSPFLDGHYQRQDFLGEMMGRPFTGFGIYGFDRVQGKYTAVWVDSMGTGTMTMTGTSKDEGKTIEYGGDVSCPIDGSVIPMRSV